MNPYLNALLAAAYIVFVVYIMGGVVDQEPLEGTLLLPIMMLSLFVLSASVMGLLFVYKPLQLHLDNRREEALLFFVKTIATFALLVVVYIACLFFILQ